ncbi:holo-ACP synthase [Azovibrio restrictus]|uniref:holo-ACP synthase n=1 Tax=Azovibrio restrictus TaxID=146938 RepID=UPI0026F0C97C|nr:holo-ACP synthase [Azovibrio restrictus]
MIHGIGTDIVAVSRLARLLERHGSRGVGKILAPHEQDELAKTRNPARFLARRWAAKEAFGKALGTGIRPPALLTAIGVGHDELGKPCFILAPDLQAVLESRQLIPHLSISDEAEYAVAYVILERP